MKMSQVPYITIEQLCLVQILQIWSSAQPSDPLKSFICCIYNQDNSWCLLLSILFLLSEGKSGQYGRAGETTLHGTSG
jgi:hypothetical protein